MLDADVVSKRDVRLPLNARSVTQLRITLQRYTEGADLEIECTQ